MLLDDKNPLYCSLCTSRPRKRPKHQDKIPAKDVTLCQEWSHGIKVPGWASPRFIFVTADALSMPMRNTYLVPQWKSLCRKHGRPLDTSCRSRLIALTSRPSHSTGRLTIQFLSPQLSFTPYFLNPLRADHLVFVLCYCVLLLDDPCV